MRLTEQWVVIVILIALLTLVAQPANANDIDALLLEDRLRVATNLTPVDNIQARQKVTLNIRIDTDTRFAGGTRIGRVAVANAIVLQRNQFAVNSAFNQGGKSWTSQLWQLEIFPLDAGDFVIPSIELDLTVATDTIGESVKGKAYTQQVAFSVAKPALLADADIWVASDRFSVKESYDKPVDTFIPGDALVRTITMSVNDIPAMMLPEVITEETDGLAIYQKPAQVSDRSNRGQSTGTRKETITYVFERPGEYSLPEVVFYWWNTKKDSLELVTLPEQRFLVEGEVIDEEIAEKDTATDTPLDLQQLKQLALWLVGLAVLYWVGFRVVKLIRRLIIWRKQQALKPPSPDKLASQFKHACEKQDAHRAIVLLYQWADTYATAPYESALRPALSKLGEEQTLALFNEVTNSLYNQSQSSQTPELKNFADKILEIIEIKPATRLAPLKPVELKLN